MLNRFGSIFDKDQSSNAAHLSEWKVAIEDTIKSPWTGLGLGSEHRETPGFDLDRKIVHNAFLMLWMKMGLPSVLLLTWLLFNYANNCIRVLKLKKKNSSYDFYSSVYLGIFSSVGFWFSSMLTGPTWFYLRETMLMALTLALVRNMEKEIISTKMNNNKNSI
jgi:O-antigen ligase